MGVAGCSDPAATVVEAEAAGELDRNAVAATTKFMVIEITRSRRERVMEVLLEESDSPAVRG